MMRGLVAIAAPFVLVACASAPTPTTPAVSKPPAAPPRPPTTASSAAAPKTEPVRHRGLAAYRASFGGKLETISRGSSLPGCTDAELARAYTLVHATLQRAHDERNATLEADAKALWQSPCFVLVARHWPLPSSFANVGALRAFLQRFGRAESNLGGLSMTEDGVRVLFAPEEPARALTEHEKRALAPFACASANDPACTSARSYVTRAEQRFASDYWVNVRFEERELLEHGASFRWCAEARDGDEGLSPWDRWLTCARAVRPTKRVYAKDVALSAPTRGWLLLRGRRGHYDFSDEVRAYDLATGAAYVASSSAALVLTDDQAAKGVRKRDLYAGRVALEHVRELAFVLVTAPAVVAEQPAATLVVPEGVVPTWSTAKPPTPNPHLGEWRSSNDTTLSWSLAEGSDVRAHGTITWPASPRIVESHADELIEVLEAGLVRGCSPAPLPASLPLGGKVRVSPLDGNATEVGREMRDLEHALVALKPTRCP